MEEKFEEAGLEKRDDYIDEAQDDGGKDEEKKEEEEEATPCGDDSK